mgnify:FL=1
MITIKVKNLQLNAEVGAFAHEKNVTREIIVNIEYQIDGSDALAADKLKNTVDYHPLATKIIEQVEGNKFNIIEYVAGFVLDIVMAHDERIQKATVTIDKPRAIKESESCSATVSAERK